MYIPNCVLQRFPTLRHVQPGEGVPAGTTTRQLLARRGNEDVHARELQAGGGGDVEMQEMRRNGEVSGVGCKLPIVEGCRVNFANAGSPFARPTLHAAHIPDRHGGHAAV